MVITKRDGRKTDFNKDKIKIAVLKAFIDVDGEETAYTKEKARDIANYIESLDKDMDVESIQNIVEEKLMASNRKDVARSYVRFRYKRELMREAQTTLDNEIFGLKDGTSEETRNNANKDGKKLQTLKPMIADVTIIDQAKRLFFPERIMREHGKKMYVHDMNYAGLPIFNCINVKWEDTLTHGAILGNAPITDPKSFEVAIALISQIASHVSSNCYGGVTFPNLTRGLSKYAKKSLEKYRVDAKKWVSEENRREDYAWEHLAKEIKDGCQSLEYEIQTLMNSRGESPFLTIEVNTVDENADEETQKIQKMICEGFLNQRIRGLDGRTPEFPKMVFELRRGNNLEKTDPYYDLFQLAIKCSSLRCYPDYLNYDKIVEVTGSYKPPMSCVDENEIICYRFLGDTYYESFKRMWNRLSNYYDVKLQPDNQNLYMDTLGVEIFDTKEGFVKNHRIIKNKTDEWMRISFSNGRTLTCTLDHPFETENRGVVLAKDLSKDDVISIGKKAISMTDSISFNKDKAWLLGLMLCDGCYDKHITCSLNCEGEDDIIEKCESVLNKCYCINTKKVDYSDTPRRHYIDVQAMTSNDNRLIEFMNYFIAEFGGIKKNDRQIPNEVFSWDRESQLAFMAGMIDADGYINNTKVLRVQMGSVNKELALQQAMLVRQLGYDVQIYINHYSKRTPNAIRYRVEFTPDTDIIKYMASQKKIGHMNDWERKNESILSKDYCSVNNVEYFYKDGYSYDVTTESEHFEVSGIYSHNCRSFLQPIKDENGKDIPYGFNQGVVSVNLVRHALLANGDETKFYELLKDTLDNYVVPIHMIRHNQLKTVKAEQAPILYMYGIVDRLNPEESIEKLLYKDRSSISIGYVGVHNALKALYGKSFDEDKTMVEKAQKMIKFLSDYCDELKEKTNIGFSLYSTPAEVLATKFCKQDIKDFGVIEGVTDEGYYENSFHYPSNEDIIAFDKVSLEGEMSWIPRGGAIQYVELGDTTKNLKAIEDIVRYAYDKCHYFGVNVAADKCFECGYVGMMKTIGSKNEDFECPCCGNKDPLKMSIIRRLCGYFSDLAQRKSVDNKMKEIAHRVNHTYKGECE